MDHAFCCGSNLPRTSGAECAGDIESATAFEHRDYVVDADAFEQPEMSGRDIDGALCIVKRVGLVGTARSQLSRQLRGVFALAKLTRNPCPIAL